MRCLTLLVALLAAGCDNVIGPLEHRPVTRVDDPRLSIREQERAARDRLPLPDESPRALPPSGVLEGPGMTVRQ